MNCNKCSTKAEHKMFNTFSYWYCNSCRMEVSTEAKLSIPSLPSEAPVNPSLYQVFKQIYTSQSVPPIPGAPVPRPIPPLGTIIYLTKAKLLFANGMGLHHSRGESFCINAIQKSLMEIVDQLNPNRVYSGVSYDDFDVVSPLYTTVSLHPTVSPPPPTNIVSTPTPSIARYDKVYLLKDSPLRDTYKKSSAYGKYHHHIIGDKFEVMDIIGSRFDLRYALGEYREGDINLFRKV